MPIVMLLLTMLIAGSRANAGDQEGLVSFQDFAGTTNRVFSMFRSRTSRVLASPGAQPSGSPQRQGHTATKALRPTTKHSLAALGTPAPRRRLPSESLKREKDSALPEIVYRNFLSEVVEGLDKWTPPKDYGAILQDPDDSNWQKMDTAALGLADVMELGKLYIAIRNTEGSSYDDVTCRGCKFTSFATFPNFMSRKMLGARGERLRRSMPSLDLRKIDRWIRSRPLVDFGQLGTVAEEKLTRIVANLHWQSEAFDAAGKMRIAQWVEFLKRSRIGASGMESRLRSESVLVQQMIEAAGSDFDVPHDISRLITDFAYGNWKEFFGQISANSPAPLPLPTL